MSAKGSSSSLSGASRRQPETRTLCWPSAHEAQARARHVESARKGRYLLDEPALSRASLWVASKMTVVGICRLKDEVDILEETIRHMASQVDSLLIWDNGSSDGSLELL